ncbi:hypothetical protein [Gluconobacter japonicus]|uniref:hypothetical protein n=1 Tax=Gluconobacter japonicus TaxID=376620 RepID=UPI0039EA7353
MVIIFSHGEISRIKGCISEYFPTLKTHPSGLRQGMLVPDLNPKELSMKPGAPEEALLHFPYRKPVVFLFPQKLLRFCAPCPKTSCAQVSALAANRQMPTSRQSRLRKPDGEYDLLSSASLSIPLRKNLFSGKMPQIVRKKTSSGFGIKPLLKRPHGQT